MDATYTYRGIEVSYNGKLFVVCTEAGYEGVREEPGLDDEEAAARAKQIAEAPHEWTDEVPF